MNKYLAIFFSLYASLGYTQNFDPNLLTTNAIENNLEPLENLTCEKQGNFIQQKAKECVQTICGPAAEVKSAFLSGEEFDNFNFEAADKSLESVRPDMRKAILASLTNRKAILVSIKKIIEKYKKEGELSLSTSEKSNILFDVFKKNLNFEMNLETGKANSTYDLYEQKNEVVKQGFDQLAEYINNEIGSNIELKFDLNQQLSLNEVVSHGKSVLEAIDTVIEDKGIIDMQFIDYFNGTKRHLESLEANNVNKPTMYRDIILRLRELRYTVLNKYKVDLLPKYDFCQKDSCDELFKNFLTNKIQSQLEKISGSLDQIEQDPDAIIDSCKSAFYLDAYNAKSVEEASLRNTQANLMNSLKKFLDHIAFSYSMQTAEEFNGQLTYATNTAIRGQSSPQKPVYWKSTNLINQSKVYKASDITKYSDGKIIKSLLSPWDFLSSTQASCNLFDDSLLLVDDYYNPYSNTLNISSYTCDHPEHGEQIFTHELTHMLSDFINSDGASSSSAKQFKKLRKCVNGKVLLPNYNLNYKTFSEDHLNSEEDFADYLSNRIYRGKNELGNPNNFQQCAFLPSSNKTYAYINLDYSEFDTHSPSFFRLINQLIDRDIELPASCGDTLKRYEHIYKPVKCRTE